MNNIVHLTSNFSRNGGGPFTTIRRLAQCQLAMGAKIHVIGFGKLKSDKDLSAWNPLTPIICSRQFIRIADHPYNISIELKKVHADIVHLHGLWTYSTFSGGRWAQAVGKPYLISPRGMLEPWALKYHWWKKMPAWWGWEKKNVENASLLHATSELEAFNLRALGLKNPIAVITNGVDIPVMFEKEHNENFHTVLFLSRIHPIKGLLNLVKAWSILRPSNWRVLVVGPDEVGHGKEVQNAIHKAGMEGLFDFRGPVYGEEKWDLYQKADLFVLSTFGENFGMVIAEALASRVPVITTKGAPWKELESFGCGWWVDFGVDPLVSALRDAIALSDSDREAMGQRGRKLMEEKYPWPKIAEQMLSVCSWAIEGGERPDCVQLWSNNRKVFI